MNGGAPDEAGDVRLQLDGLALDVATTERLGQALDEAAARTIFELVACVDEGPAIFMLRNGPHAWLMYLREPGHTGFHSCGNPDREGVAAFTRSNGQVDEHPLAWCIDVEQCLQAIAYFCVNDGTQPPWLAWSED